MYTPGQARDIYIYIYTHLGDDLPTCRHPVPVPHPINFPAAHRKPSHQQTAKKLTRRRSVNENSCCFESLLVLGFGHCLGLGLGLGIGGVGLGRGGKRRGGKLRGSRSRRQASRRQALRRQVEEAGLEEAGPEETGRRGRPPGGPRKPPSSPPTTKLQKS